MNGNPDMIIEYKTKMLQGLKRLTKNNVEDIKFILTDTIGEGILENINSALDLFTILQKLNWISVENNQYLYKLLRAVDRHDIVSILKGGSSGTISPPVISQNDNDSSNNQFNRKILNAVAKEICSQWKFLARELDIPETDIEMIDLDNNKVYEKSISSLKKWTQLFPNLASWEYLRSALSRVPRHDIIRKIEKEFPDLLSGGYSPVTQSPVPPTMHRCVQESSITPKETNTETILSANISSLHLEEKSSELCSKSLSKECSEYDTDDDKVTVVTSDGRDLKLVVPSKSTS